MEIANERKWFVYLGDHHEGPFSHDEMRAKLLAGAITPTHFVWREGMADWKAMTEVAELADLVPAKAKPEPTPEPEPEPIAPEPATREEPATPEPVAPEPARAAPPPLETEHPSLLDERTGAVPVKRGISTGFKRVLALLFLLAALGGAFLYLGGGSGGNGATAQSVADQVSRWIQPLLSSWMDRYPDLAKWISPIPRIDGLSDFENEELQLAARAPISEQGAKASLALAPGNVSFPSFYLATNLPDRPLFDVWIRGIRGKVVGQIDAEFRTQIRVERRLGKSEPVRAPGGALPKGEYLIWVMESLEQPPAVKEAFAKAKVPPTRGVIPEGLPADRKMLIRKSHFLGGKKDAAYQAELKDYLDRLNLSTQTELKEVRDLHGFLSAQLSSSDAQRKKPAKGPKARAAANAAKAWAAFDRSWKEARVARWEPKAQAWTPEAIQAFFYGKLFEMTLATAAMIDQAHESAGAKAPPEQVTLAFAQARTALETLDRKIGEMEKLGPGPDGLPRKDGL